MEYRYEFAGQVTVVQLEAAGDGYRVIVAGRVFQVKAHMVRPGELNLEFEAGQRQTAWVAADGARRWVALAAVDPVSQPFLLTVPQAGQTTRRQPASRPAALEAQMPGVVRRVLAAPGDHVTRGQVLVLLEAMKMEIRISAPHAGIVARVAIVEGQAVERGQTLVELAAGSQATPAVSAE